MDAMMPMSPLLSSMLPRPQMLLPKNYELSVYFVDTERQGTIEMTRIRRVLPLFYRVGMNGYHIYHKISMPERRCGRAVVTYLDGLREGWA